MLLINLIAARRAERKKRELIRAVLLRSMAGVGVAGLLASAFMTFSIQIVNNRIDDVTQQTAMLQDTVTQVERLQASMGALQPRVATLLKAQNATNRWRAVLQEISVALPEKTWITSFASQSGASDGFTITGQSVSQNQVGKAMMRLGTQDYIKEVSLQYTQAAGKSNSVTFALTGALEPLEEEKTDAK
jgi:Tfp pilus assembly protein PilN